MRALAAFLFCLATPALAQDWATRDLCYSAPQPVTAEDLAPFEPAALEAEAARIANPRGRFWQIDHPGGGVSHLWGTMHVSLAPVLDLPDALTTAIEEARIVAVEVDYTYPDRASMAERFNEPERYRDAGDAFLPEAALDLSFLGPEVEAALIERLGGGEFGEEMLYVMSYAGLAEQILSDPCEDFSAGVIPSQDSYIQTLAHIAGAELRGLEDASEFVRDLSTDDDTARAIIALYAAYLPPPDRLENYNAVVQLYLEGRLGMMAAWEKALQQDTYGAAGLEYLERADAYLLALRNRRFLDRIAPELASGGVVLAVGAAHLSGDTGLVEMLRRDGYTVTRMPLPGEAP